MEFCTNNGVLIAFKIIGYLIFIVKIIVPLLLIIMGIIDFSKALISNDEKSISDAISTFIRRFIAAIIIFFIPTILSFVLDLVDGANETLGTFTNCTSCLLKPTSCDTKDLGEDMPEHQTEASGEQLEEAPIINTTKDAVSNATSTAVDNILNAANEANTNQDSTSPTDTQKSSANTGSSKSSSDKYTDYGKKYRNYSLANLFNSKLSIKEGIACFYDSKNGHRKVNITKCNKKYCIDAKNLKTKYEIKYLYDPPCGITYCSIEDKKIVLIVKCNSSKKNSQCITNTNNVYKSDKLTKDLNQCNK